jgi:hypothetical protein
VVQKKSQKNEIDCSVKSIYLNACIKKAWLEKKMNGLHHEKGSK